MEHAKDTGKTRNILQLFGTNLGRLFISIAIPLVTFLVLRWVFIFLRDSNVPKTVTAVVAILWGVGGALALFFVTNYIIEQLGDEWNRRLTPYVFVGPAVAILVWYLLLPTVRSFITSLYDAGGKNFIGLDNYIYAFTSPPMLESFRNNLIWLTVGTGLSVVLGLTIAVLSDRTHSGFETFIKSLIFMPMAISMVGASVIWKFIYNFRPAGSAQIGVLNAIVTALGGDPQAWMILKPWNTLFLIIIMIWLQTGFAMVILSAAIKGIPAELLEAGRIDGANEAQIFFRISIPYIRGTIITVSTTIVLFSLKIFDIVQAMTGGNFGTQVIANEQYTQMFRAFNFGRGAAIAIVLLILVTPVMYYNLRQFAQQTEAF